MDTLQELFIGTKGQPVRLGSDTVIQMDSVPIPASALITVRFIGDEIYRDNAAVIAVDKPGKIFLSDGSVAKAVAIWDEPSLPRTASHRAEARGGPLKIYNKYRTWHDGWCSEDSFTGNAGMVVTELATNRRLYECSNGPGAFRKTDLMFEVEWQAGDLQP